MTLYKFIDEQNIIMQTNPVFIENNRYIANPTIDDLKNSGYKPLVFDEIPEINENEYLETVYINENDFIISSFRILNLWEINSDAEK